MTILFANKIHRISILHTNLCKVPKTSKVIFIKNRSSDKTYIRKIRYLPLIFTIKMLCVLQFFTSPALTNQKVSRFLDGLSTTEKKIFKEWHMARSVYDSNLTAYWQNVEHLHQRRRKKKLIKQPLIDQDYVINLPPKYNGPKLSVELLSLWQTFRSNNKPIVKLQKHSIPDVDDYLESAKRHYDFVPERIKESEYKRRYAIEALSYGLTKDQVVRVFALETGGNGTAIMQAGVHPIKKTGHPISSALGYAQLLAANSVNVISKHGAKFITRLEQIIKNEHKLKHRKKLQLKLISLRSMYRTARSIPHQWSKQRALARTSLGMGLHALNIDGLIGPWMQVVKLADIKKLAERHNLFNISGAKLELMNLAGPGTGLEMMTKVGLDKPTTNFFSRRSYYRNSIVHQRTSAQLIKEINKRMNVNLKKRGSREFVAIFDKILAGRNDRKNIHKSQ
ncbi:MAG: hypothetical protein TECD_00972 [Hyphomicrobiaceae bacterium hypho_1]